MEEDSDEEDVPELAPLYQWCEHLLDLNDFELEHIIHFVPEIAHVTWTCRRRAGEAAQGQGAHVSAQQRTAWRRRDGARRRTEGAGSERGIVGGDGTGAWLAVAR